MLPYPMIRGLSDTRVCWISAPVEHKLIKKRRHAGTFLLYVKKQQGATCMILMNDIKIQAASAVSTCTVYFMLNPINSEPPFGMLFK